MASQVHTVHVKGTGWLNQLNGSQVGPSYTTKDDAVTAGRALAIKHSAEHFIHNLDGTIGSRNSYGNDPKGRG